MIKGCLDRNQSHINLRHTVYVDNYVENLFLILVDRE